MDLITQLPNSREYDAILTIVDHKCTQAALFFPCSTNVTGEGIAKLYLDNRGLQGWFRWPHSNWFRVWFWVWFQFDFHLKSAEISVWFDHPRWKFDFSPIQPVSFRAEIKKASPQSRVVEWWHASHTSTVHSLQQLTTPPNLARRSSKSHATQP